MPDLCPGQGNRRSDWWAIRSQSLNSGFNPAISYSQTLILAAGWLRLKCEELGSRYRMPSRAEIAKMGGDDDREDKERVMAGLWMWDDFTSMLTFFAGAFKCWWAPTVQEWECMCLTCALWSMLVWRWLKFSHRLVLALTDLLGLPRNLWKVPQTFGRAGRDKKLQAVGVQMYWPGQKGLLIWIFY